MACNGMDQFPDSTSTTIPAVGLIMYPQDNSLKAFRSIINPNALILHRHTYLIPVTSDTTISLWNMRHDWQSLTYYPCPKLSESCPSF